MGRVWFGWWTACGGLGWDESFCVVLPSGPFSLFVAGFFLCDFWEERDTFAVVESLLEVCPSSGVYSFPV